MFSYKGLEQKLSERNIGRSDLAKMLGISSRTVAMIGKGEKHSPRDMENRMVTRFFIENKRYSW